MTNAERYKVELRVLHNQTVDGVGVNEHNGKPVACGDFPCSHCAIKRRKELGTPCEHEIITWLLEENEEGEEMEKKVFTFDHDELGMLREEMDEIREENKVIKFGQKAICALLGMNVLFYVVMLFIRLGA